MDFEGAKKHIILKINKELNKKYFYHSLGHTIDVFNATITIGLLENISQHQFINLQTAALFHDAGIIYKYVGHEEESVKIAKDILPKYGYEKHDIDEIEKMIMATDIFAEPSNLLEEILCDADLFYLGSERYFEKANSLRKEWEMNDLTFSLREWYELQIKFLTKHKYFTKTAKRLQEKKKQENLQKIITLLNTGNS